MADLASNIFRVLCLIHREAAKTMKRHHYYTPTKMCLGTLKSCSHNEHFSSSMNFAHSELHIFVHHGAHPKSSVATSDFFQTIDLLNCVELSDLKMLEMATCCVR